MVLDTMHWAPLHCDASTNVGENDTSKFAEKAAPCKFGENSNSSDKKNSHNIPDQKILKSFKLFRFYAESAKGSIWVWQGGESGQMVLKKWNGPTLCISMWNNAKNQWKSPNFQIQCFYHGISATSAGFSWKNTVFYGN